jgi:site-specific recombinase XerD
MTDDWHSEYPTVQRMLDYLRLRKSGSLQSARTLCRILAAFCTYYQMTPDALHSVSRERIEELVQQYCDRLVERSRLNGMSARYANTVLACLKTYFCCNGFNRENGSELRVKCYHQPPRITNRAEYVPTPKETLTMGERSGCKRNRAVILTIATTGLRNSASRALKVSDVLAQIREGKQILLINVSPDWNKRVPGACKNCIPYYSFTARIATEAIKSMLEEREAMFGSCLPDEPLFISNHNQIPSTQRRIKPLTARQLELIVKKAAEAAEIPEWNNVHVHTMRKVFESVLRSPLTDGSAMDPKDQEFLMGHLLPGSQENYYDHSKVERMREVFSKLVFEEKSAAQELSIQTWRKFAKVLGVDASQVTEIKAMKEEELKRKLSVEEEEELLEQLVGEAVQHIRGRGSPKDRIVQLAELEQYTESGWNFVQQLSDGRAVIRRSE